ncbi:MAG: cation-translocating P-type ATPase [Pirellulaceae bacterium]
MNQSAERTPVWHTLSVEACYERLASDPRGLSSTEATRRLNEVGPNEIRSSHHISPWAILLDQFKNVLIIILLVAVAMSAALGHGIEAVAIGVIVLFAALLGFVQEYRAERSMEALREMAAPTATVIRDGEEMKVPARDIVPGDVIVLHAGDKAPADARLTEAVNLQMEEAALTGESVPLQKQVDPLPEPELPVGDRICMVYAGTAATYGRGRALVTSTGMDTEFGKVARMLQEVETGKTPLQQNLDKVGKALTRAALVIVAVIIVMGLFRGQELRELLIFGIALAVAVVPEALPAVVTISLAIGVQRMVRKNALVRRLTAVETLGSTSFICSDKTGTLTKDEMTARQLFVAGKTYHISGAGYEPQGVFAVEGTEVSPPEPVLELLRGGTLASDSHIARDRETGRWHVQGDPTEGALVVAAAKAGLHKHELDDHQPRTGEVPFTSESKRMTTLHQTPEGPVAYAKGAPEVILDSCSRWRSETGDEELDADQREAILSAARDMAATAHRVLAIATRRGVSLEESERDMTLLGLVGMIDPPRPEARSAIETCKQAGIRVVMITGDHPLTARAVAQELGLLTSDRVVTGKELDGMSETELAEQVRDIQVYARVSPAHKLRVVTALQDRGEIAAMTGDGVNDAPALKKAAIGIAMGITGTDVTKEAAAMTLTDDNFASIVAAVEEGRGIFGNIKKYLMYLLSANIGEIGLMAGASALGLPPPLSAVQLLYVNLATDGLPALALSVDPPEPDLMQHRPRNPHTGIFTRPVISLMLAGGLWSTCINLGLFYWATQSGRSETEAMTLTFVTLVMIEFFKAYSFRSDRHSILVRPFRNGWLNLAIFWEMILLAAVVYVPFLNAPFRTMPIGLTDVLLTAALAATVIPVIETAKWCARRGWFGELD